MTVRRPRPRARATAYRGGQGCGTLGRSRIDPGVGIVGVGFQYKPADCVGQLLPVGAFGSLGFVGTFSFGLLLHPKLLIGVCSIEIGIPVIRGESYDYGKLHGSPFVVPGTKQSYYLGESIVRTRSTNGLGTSLCNAAARLHRSEICLFHTLSEKRRSPVLYSILNPLSMMFH